MTSDASSNPRIFTFVAGGLSHHEIVSLHTLETELSCQVVSGSNQIISPRDFIAQLEVLHKIETEKKFEDDILRGELIKTDEAHDTDKLLQDDDLDNTLDYTINF